MFKKGLIAIVLGLTLFLSSAQCGEVRVMVGFDMISNGENCKIIPIEKFPKTQIVKRTVFESLIEKAATLKEMISEGWKIDHVETVQMKIGPGTLFILTKYN